MKPLSLGKLPGQAVSFLLLSRPCLPLLLCFLLPWALSWGMVGEGFTFPRWLDPRSGWCPAPPVHLPPACRGQQDQLSAPLQEPSTPQTALWSPRRGGPGAVFWTGSTWGGLVKIKLVGPDPSTLGSECLRL